MFMVQPGFTPNHKYFENHLKNVERFEHERANQTKAKPFGATYDLNDRQSMMTFDLKKPDYKPRNTAQVSFNSTVNQSTTAHPV